MPSDSPERVCDHCGSYIEPTRVLYRLRIELAAEPGPIDIEPMPPLRDVREELADLIRKLNGMDPEQVDEATSQVHEQFDFVLCAGCRAEIRDRLRRRIFVAEAHTD